MSEHDTWQKAMARFLQKKLELLPVDDPLLIKNSNEVLRFINSHPAKNLKGFSVDITDLYYSLPHKGLLRCVDHAIDAFGGVAFQNESGISNEQFLELL